MKQLSLEKIFVRFGEVEALSDMTVSLGAGDICMLVGPNGAGKSTLIKVLLGLVRQDSGSLRVDGKVQQVDNSLKEKIGYLPESVAFSDNLTAKQVLSFFARARAVKKERIDEVLEQVGLTHAARRNVRGYSRGMRQRLGLAVSILHKPTLLILDEPTGGLDQEGLSVLWDVLKEWKAENRIVLMSTHDLALLERRVTQMCVFRTGRLLFSGCPEELRSSASLLHTVQMLVKPEETEKKKLFLEQLKKWNKGSIEHKDDEILLSLAPDALLEFLDIRGEYPGLLRHIRIEEPTLDQIYEALLENG